MAARQLDTVLRHLKRVTAGQVLKKLTDVQLLSRFAASSDQAAFSALMQRHGTLVLSVCRHLLGHEEDAEDAFQAAFLVLARKAADVAKHDQVAGWLHRTAYHCALQVRRARARRSRHERQAGMAARPKVADETNWRELQAMLDEEVACLANKHRSPFVLCCLEGKSKAEAAAQLGWREGTVSGRLAQARKLLKQRLARRGVSLSAALCVLTLTQKVTAAIPTALADMTEKAVMEVTSGAAGTRILSAQVADVVQRVLRATFVARTKTRLAVLLAIGALIAVTGVLAHQSFSVPRSFADAANHPPTHRLEDAIHPADSGLLQGHWQVVEHTLQGAQVKRVRQFWTIADNKITVDYGGGNMEVVSFKLDETTTPKRIEFKAADGGDAKALAAGVYRLQGHSLMVCLSAGRPPTNFERDRDPIGDSDWRLLVLEKVRKN